RTRPPPPRRIREGNRVSRTRRDVLLEVAGVGPGLPPGRPGGCRPRGPRTSPGRSGARHAGRGVGRCPGLPTGILGRVAALSDSTPRGEFGDPREGPAGLTL